MKSWQLHDGLERPLLPSVNLLILLRKGEVGFAESDVVGELFPVLLEPDDERRLFVSARISSRLTFRSESVGAAEVSSSSVNLEVVILGGEYQTTAEGRLD
jgi:hypothetical protein